MGIFSNGEQMRFHKAESAFFVFIFVILAAGLVTLHAYGFCKPSPRSCIRLPAKRRFIYLNKLLFATGVLLATALFFGIFFIYPLIRKQATERRQAARHDGFAQRPFGNARARRPDRWLTGMQNRRYFDDALKEYLEEFRRIEKPVGLMILDLDHFKQVNDTHGHDVGDEVLRAVANCLKDMTRYHDVVARLGGEEFAVVTPNMDAALAGQVCRAYPQGDRQHVGALRQCPSSRSPPASGLPVWDRKETAEEFYRRADRQLYEAKRQGRKPRLRLKSRRRIHEAGCLTRLSRLPVLTD